MFTLLVRLMRKNVMLGVKMKLREYLASIHLPNPKLHFSIKENVFSFWDVIEYVKQLPYGRIADDFRDVLVENKGTCSTKHALLASIADELSIQLKLTLGMIFLTAENMPRIKSILEKYQLEKIPEAHTYLTFDNHTLDVTFPLLPKFSVLIQPEKKMFISPDQIGEFKVQQHYDFINDWIKTQPHLTFDKVWTAREECIALLSINH